MNTEEQYKPTIQNLADRVMHSLSQAMSVTQMEARIRYMEHARNYLVELIDAKIEEGIKRCDPGMACLTNALDE